MSDLLVDRDSKENENKEKSESQQEGKSIGQNILKRAQNVKVE